MVKIAVLCTTHNRLKKTEKCFKSLYNQNNIDEIYIQVYVCDDMSTDGTKEMIEKKFPAINLVVGNGDLFWTKGMSRALESIPCFDDYDFLLMINDDVEFFDDMLNIMLKAAMKREGSCIVGPTVDELKKNWTYGGHRIIKGETIINVMPDDINLRCDLAGWNCFLLPIDIYKCVGPIDAHYEHAWGDFDYCHRILKKGFSIYSAEQYVGTCNSNSTVGTWRDVSRSFSFRIKALHKKTGLPWKSSFRYHVKNYGIRNGLLLFIRPYLSIIKSSVLNYRRNNN